MSVERDTTVGKHQRSEYLCRAKLLIQTVSTRRVVSYAYRKRCHSWQVLGVKIPMLAKLLLYAVSYGRVVGYALEKRCHSR